MPHHQHHFGSGSGAGKFHAAQNVVILDITGNARVKGFTDAGVQQDLRRSA
ncbi:hypothetical protein D3C80_2145570 [compost metagenome]